MAAHKARTDIPEKDAAVTETPNKDTVATDVTKKEAASNDATKKDTTTTVTDATKKDAPAIDTPKEETATSDAPKKDTVATETAKTDTVATDTPKKDTAVTETSKQDTSQTETPKKEIPATGTTKKDTTPSDTTEKDIATLRDNLDKLETTFTSADENGLFNNITKTPNAQAPTTQQIIDDIAKAYEELNNKTNSPETRMVQGWKKQREASSKFNKALNLADPSWRFAFYYGGPFAIYFVGLLIVVLSTWLYFNPTTTATIFWVPIYAFLWGIVGGIIQGLWFLWQHVSDRQFRKGWILWYLFLPILGATLGALMYLLISAGFVTVTGSIQTRSEPFIMLLCALAGFSSKWTVQTLDNVLKMIKIGQTSSS